MTVATPPATPPATTAVTAPATAPAIDQPGGDSTPQTVARLTVTLQQPAQISDRARNDFVIGTSLFLPGAVIRGAFAARWLVNHPGYAVPGVSKPAEFLRLFEGGVRFAPLFAVDPPVPLSVVRHKYPPRPDCVPQTWDLALDGIGKEPLISCPRCESALEPGKGEVALSNGPSTSGEGNLPIAVRRRMHVAIGDDQVATRGQLVTRETLPAGLSFSGSLVADEPELIDILEGLGEIQVGGRRTTHGLATVQVERAAALSTPVVRDDGGIVLTLRSPGVFVDDTGRPCQDPNPRELADLFGAPVTVSRRWTRWTTVSGWHAASGLPKHTELAVAAGSTYVLTCENPVDPATLAAVARRGLGLRRHEGYGDVGGPPAPPVKQTTRDATAGPASRRAVPGVSGRDAIPGAPGRRADTGSGPRRRS